ncbi:MAG TPA: NHLP bacteriocin system secretion protein [Methylomusa anaerophila]|uniref:HlyD family secretion protein n=1 Tax=Methylomusa anaerophila TaxID=1930071 RepID=A0A348AHU7_9FIRM|nr:NHLP bacteriocin system secretion protein [Methylomusa anaerophila]BBB90645.1 HlyD family secretion protein [Methylomusa anaerophila]HML88747.1 NHLP bacteriocin system secretion protein [Methylomusa anaerophila]
MQKEQSQGLFRQEALEKLRSPDQLDKLFAPATPVAWIALATMLLLVFSALVWSVFGVMATKVNGTGMIIDADGLVNISSATSGRLAEIRVKVGDRIQRGQVVATVEQPDLEAQIARINRELNTAMSREDMANMVANLNELQDKLERNSRVISPVEGIVADWVASGVGDILAPGTPLLNVRIDEEARGEIKVLLYVPVLEGKKIRPGMTVQIAPGSVDATEYGTLVGQVHSVSNYPLQADSMTNWTGNKDLTTWILRQTGGAAMEVQVDLIKDNDTATGYLWSSIHGAPEKITAGTACTGSIVVKRQAPITKAFLKLNQWLRSD